MTFLHQRFLLSCLLMFTISHLIPVSSRGPIYKPPSVERLTDHFRSTPLVGKMSTFFGASNIHIKSNGSYADIILDKTSGDNIHYTYAFLNFKTVIVFLTLICFRVLGSGSGLVSKDRYHHGFFSVGIKLPMGDTSGVVLAFYVSYFL